MKSNLNDRPFDFRTARIARGWSQADLARHAGCSQAAVSLAEQSEARLSPLMLTRIRRALSSEASGVIGERVIFQYPSVDVDGIISRMGVEHRIWRRSAAGGDFGLMVPTGKGAFVVAVIDIAGRGLSVVPLAMHLQGWLRGRLGWRSGLTHLSELVGDLSSEVGVLGIGAAAFIASFRLVEGGAGRVDYEAVACGFPPPLLLQGAPPRSVPSCARWPSLPASTSMSDPILTRRLEVPWRLAVGTDGLLARLGAGKESAGVKWLRKWQTGPQRDLRPEILLATGESLDDECFVGVAWNGWDGEYVLDSQDNAERHRAIRAVGVAAGGGTETSRFWLEDAVMEVMNNAARHGYGGGNGAVRVRWRMEPDRWFRVEIADEGEGGLTAAIVEKSKGGFASIRPHVGGIDVRENAGGGMIVTLLVDKETAS